MSRSAREVLILALDTRSTIEVAHDGQKYSTKNVLDSPKTARSTIAVPRLTYGDQKYYKVLNLAVDSRK